MHSFFELTVMIYQELVGRAAHGRHERTTPVLSERLRGRILVAVADSPNGGVWPRLPGGQRVEILRRVLRDNPDLMMQATEAYELDHAIEKLAKEVVKRKERHVVKALRKREVDPANPEQVAERLRRDRGLLSEVAQKGTIAIPYPIVLALELEEIRKSRRKRDPKGELGRLPGEEDPELMGLALSGGGIRSATFNLGILQGLADLNLLRHVDYLSTVSGGGYIGGWLTAWCKREGRRDGICAVQTALSPQLSPNPAGEDQAPLRFLREYSNYLTPKSGFFTADTWTLVTEWIRNTLLNQTVLVLFLAGILLVPHALVRFAFPRGPWGGVAVAVSVALFVLAVFFIALNMSSFDTGRTQPLPRAPGKQGTIHRWADRLRRGAIQPKWVLRAVVLPALAAAFTFTMWHVPLVLREASRLSTSEVAGSGVWADLGSRVHSGLTSLHLLDPRAVAANAGQQIAGDALIVTLILFLSLLVVSFLGRFDRCFYEGRAGTTRPRRWIARLGILGSVICASIVGGLLTVLFSQIWLTDVATDVSKALDQSATHAANLVTGIGPTENPAAGSAWSAKQREHLIAAFTFGPPLLLQVFALAVVVQIGLLGRNLSDERREWWSRLGASVLIFCFGWTLIAGVSLYGPSILSFGVNEARTRLSEAGVVAWLATTIVGVFSGQSSRTGPKAKGAGLRPRLLNALALAAPYVFIIGLLLLISYGLHRSLGPRSGALAATNAVPSTWIPLILAVVCVVVAFGLAMRFDVNEFSMHHFYKNRLVRCYLGASRLKERKANPFTGFDTRDEVKLATLRVAPIRNADPPYVGPYPIVNVALNLVGGKNLAWQERKAESFVFTPQFCGYAYNPPDNQHTREGQDRDQRTARFDPLGRQRCTVESYRPTRRYGYGDDCGIGLGTAMAISGAAANPNMGYHSSPAVSFLMTMFNVRLGWWLGNPRGSRWQESSPSSGLTYLLKELMGTTTDTSSFVNLSDGGHFENLGLYELVRRRCRYIIACDAAQDPGPAFADLGNAIRKCRTDLGVEIDVSLDRMRELGKSEYARAHGTVGTIKYPNGSKGLLLYLKTSLTRDESVDLLEYSIREPEFPNQSTADQWFDESQFESYRKLGHHSISATLKTAEERWMRRDGLEALFGDLSALWFPPTPAIAKFGRKHAEAYDQLMERVRETGLRDLDSVLFPGAHIAAQRNGKGILNRFFKPPVEPGIDRDEFYVVNSLIQLMETVFVDLNIDEERSHPHNAGWIEIFRGWAKSPRLQAVWQDSGQTYSSRFQRFCERTLELKPPRVEVTPEASRRL